MLILKALNDVPSQAWLAEEKLCAAANLSPIEFNTKKYSSNTKCIIDGFIMKLESWAAEAGTLADHPALYKAKDLI